MISTIETMDKNSNKNMISTIETMDKNYITIFILLIFL